MKTFSQIILLILATSCLQNHDIKIDTNSDTIQVIRYYSSKAIREVTIYKNNKPFSNVCFNESGDTLKRPTAFFNKSNDSIFVYFPINKYSKVDLNIDKDSLKQIMGLPVQYSIKDLKHPIMLPIKPNMFTGKNEVYGTVTCTHKDGYITYYAFLARQN